MANLNTIKNWFKTGLKPTQVQFWDTWDSFWHKDDTIPANKIENLDQRFDEKADNDALESHLNDDNAHNISELLEGKASVEQLEAEATARENAIAYLQGQVEEIYAMVDENTPIAENEAEAIDLGLSNYKIYITSTGEVRYKLPVGTIPNPPLDASVNNEDKEFTFTSPEI